jgi:cysteine synthase
MFGFFKNWKKINEKYKRVAPSLSMMTYEKLQDYQTDISKKFNHLWKLVGNTPILEILYRYEGVLRSVYAKAEHYNLTGSIKDRVALYILQSAYKEGTIKPYSRIVEASSGNTAISIAAIGRALGHRVTILMPDWLSKERKGIIRSLGAEIIPVSREDGGFKGCIERAEMMAVNDPDIFLPRLFENPSNAEAHSKTTAWEIWSQLEGAGLKPDAFVAGVGTGGTVMGMCNYLKAKNQAIQVHPLEPHESPTLSTGYKNRNHRIQGISDEFIAAIVTLDKLDSIVRVSDGDAILMAQKMACELGLAVGISSGANILGAIFVQQQMGGNPVVVTVLPDTNKKYLSTDLLKTEKPLRGYLSQKIELLDYIPLQKASEA